MDRDLFLAGVGRTLSGTEASGHSDLSGRSLWHDFRQRGRSHCCPVYGNGLSRSGASLQCGTCQISGGPPSAGKTVALLRENSDKWHIEKNKIIVSGFRQVAIWQLLWEYSGIRRSLPGSREWKTRGSVPMA